MFLETEPKTIPGSTMHTLEQYVARFALPEAGGFVRAVLENDLRGAFERADLVNRAAIADILHWLIWVAPTQCWGSKEKVEDWLSGSGPTDAN